MRVRNKEWPIANGLFQLQRVWADFQHEDPGRKVVVSLLSKFLPLQVGVENRENAFHFFFFLPNLSHHFWKTTVFSGK